MANFAEIDENGLVLRVVRTNDSLPEKGLEWLEKNFGGTWIETFEDGSQRVRFASKGFSYDSDRDAFITPKYFDSWILNEETLSYEAPVLYPEDGKDYDWDEEDQTWVEIPD